MPQDQSASRMMSTLQTSLSQGSQQFIDPTQGLQQPQQTQSIQPTPQTTSEEVISDSTVSPSQLAIAEPQMDAGVNGQTQVVTATSPKAPTSPLSDQQKLSLFENVMQEVEASRQQLPAQPSPSSVSKESIASGGVASPELPGGMQYADIEPVPEISPEIESFLQHAQEQPDKLPEEIVQAAAQFHQESVNEVATQAVKVLPITKVQAEKGKKKSTSFAVRWLVEFSNKVSHLFAGKSIYRAD